MSRQQRRHILRTGSPQHMHGSVARQKRRVLRKRTHIRLHGDEALWNEIGSMYGEELLPGFASAPIELIDSGLHLETGRDGWWYLEHEQTACGGVCGGPWDEHSVAPEKFPNTNSARQMAVYLSVENKRALKEMLAYSLRSDRGSNRGPFDLDPIMKAWWRGGVAFTDVMQMYKDIYYGLHHVFSGLPAVSVPTDTFREMLVRWTAHTFAPKKAPVGAIAGLPNVQAALLACGRPNAFLSQIINLDNRTGGKTPFDLEGLWDAMWAAGIDPAAIESIMTTSLSMKYLEEQRFSQAELEFGRDVQYVPGDSRYPYKVAVVRSDSDYINRACRKVDSDIDVLIMVLSSGHVRVFNIHKRISMDYVAANLRYGELRKRGPCSPDMAALRAKGTLVRVLEWYNSHDGLGVFNSTETSPGTRRTTQVTREVVSHVREGLAAAWRYHHVPCAASFNAATKRGMDRRREQRQQRANP